MSFGVVEFRAYGQKAVGMFERCRWSVTRSVTLLYRLGGTFLLQSIVTFRAQKLQVVSDCIAASYESAK